MSILLPSVNLTSFKQLLFFIVVVCLWLCSNPLLGQTTTTWTGVRNNDWDEGRNWTNGVPDKDTHAVIKKSVGGTDPVLEAAWYNFGGIVRNCLSLTIEPGNTLEVASTLTTLHVSEKLEIKPGGTFILEGSNLNVSGNWYNSGSYSERTSSFLGSPPQVTFNGTKQEVGGSAVTIFNNVTISQGATVTLKADVSINRLSGRATLFRVNGTLIPENHKITWNSNDEFTLAATGRLHVTAPAYYTNYSRFPTQSAGATIEYSGVGAQAVAAENYQHLVLSRNGVKTFAAGTTGIAGSLTVTGGAKANTLTNSTTINYNGTTQDVFPMDYYSLLLSNGGAKKFTGTTGVARSLAVSGGAAEFVQGKSTINYNGAGNQQVLPANYYSLELSNSGTKTFSGTTGIAESLTLTNATADLTTANAVINFNGTAAQNIPGLSYHTLQVSGGSMKTLRANAQVARSIQLTNGRIATQQNRIIVSNSGSIVGENNTNYITGTVETTRNVTTTETFGSLGLTVTPTKGTPGTLKVTRTTGAQAAVGNSNNVQRYFRLEPASPNPENKIDISMSYLDHELKDDMRGHEQELTFFWSETNTPAAHWRNVPPSATPAGRQVKASSLTHSGYYTLGRVITPLPVELMNFTAARAGHEVVLRWATASEQNNSGFEVQVSSDGITYQKIGFVESRVGTSSVKQEYSFTDSRSSKSGRQYYRLRQLDYDGTSKVYGPRMVDFGTVTRTVPAVVFPNPFTGSLRMNMQAVAGGIANVKLYTTTGKLLAEEQVQIEVGKNEQALSLAEAAYKPGLYLLVIELNGTQQTIKLMKE
ncbi:MAG TPA: T9SS type A sorting domain-containing protein [Pontibacter sp.]